MVTISGDNGNWIVLASRLFVYYLLYLYSIPCFSTTPGRTYPSCPLGLLARYNWVGDGASRHFQVLNDDAMIRQAKVRASGNRRFSFRQFLNIMVVTAETPKKPLAEIPRVSGTPLFQEPTRGELWFIVTVT